MIAKLESCIYLIPDEHANINIDTHFMNVESVLQNVTHVKAIETFSESSEDKETE